MNLKRYTFLARALFTFFLSVLPGGCGGGASGTGGIIGDLNPTQKVEESSSEEKRALCSRVVSVATDALRSDRSLSVLAVLSTLTEKYVVSETIDSADGTQVTLWKLTPEFKNLTKDAFVSECEGLLHSIVENVSTEGQCFDTNQRIPSIEWNPPSPLEPGAISGPCDLNNPNFSAIKISVGEYAACVAEYFNSQIFSPTTELSCEGFYDAINQPDPSLGFDPSQYVRNLPQYSRDVCRTITQQLGGSLFYSSPVVCDARPALRTGFSPGVFLSGG